MKKAFTMLELVFVIVVMGILAAVIIPNTRSNPVHEAAVQLANHIKYTQHLAMTDDRYDSTNVNWHRQRWQIAFSSAVTPNSDVTYTIFSDTAGTSTGDADISEIAINPEDSGKLLSGGYGSTIASTHIQMTKKLNLEASYGITSVTLGAACNSGARISYDHLGRPFHGDQSSMTGPYTAGTQRLITANCDITITDGSETAIIRIAPETGFTCVLNTGGTACI